MDLLHYQGVSDPLAAQTITGTVKGQFRCQENFAGNIDAEPQLKLYVVSNDGSSVRGVLLDFDGATTPDAHEYATALTNRSFPRGGVAAVSSVVCQAGDRIVSEVGSRKTAVASASRTATLDFGDAGASDLPEDESTTTQLNPWLEFSQTLVFQSAGVTIAASGIPSGEAWGLPKLNLRTLGQAIGSAAALGLAKLNLALRAIGVASGEQTGKPRLALALKTIGVTSGEAFGLPLIRVRLLAGGTASAGAVGTPKLALAASPRAIQGGEQFGSATLRLTVDAIGVVSGEQFGRPLVFVFTVPSTTPGVPGGVYVSDLQRFMVSAADLARHGVRVGDLPVTAVTVADLLRFGIRIEDVPRGSEGLSDD